MNGKVKNIIWVIIFIVFIGSAYYAYNILSADFDTRQDNQLHESKSLQDSATKTAAADFIVFDNQGRKVKLSDFKGKPIVLNFWASWCPPCRNEMPDFDKVYAEAGEKVVFMMVDLVDGQRETQAQGQAFIKEQGFGFPVYFDNQQNAAFTYRITSIPATYFINEDGNIAASYQGAINQDILENAVELIEPKLD